MPKRLKECIGQRVRIYLDNAGMYFGINYELKPEHWTIMTDYHVAIEAFVHDIADPNGFVALLWRNGEYMPAHKVHHSSEFPSFPSGYDYLMLAPGVDFVAEDRGAPFDGEPQRKTVCDSCGQSLPSIGNLFGTRMGHCGHRSLRSLVSRLSWWQKLWSWL